MVGYPLYNKDRPDYDAPGVGSTAIQRVLLLCEFPSSLRRSVRHLGERARQHRARSAARGIFGSCL